jgi:hypothetical protein
VGHAIRDWQHIIPMSNSGMIASTSVPHSAFVILNSPFSCLSRSFIPLMPTHPLDLLGLSLPKISNTDEDTVGVLIYLNTGIFPPE